MARRLDKENFVGKLLLVVCAACFALSCGKKNSKKPLATDVLDTQMETGNEVNPVNEKCTSLAAQANSQALPYDKSEIGLILREISESPDVEFILLDPVGKRLNAKRLCTNSAASILLQSDIQEDNATLMIRENVSKKLFMIENAKLQIGKRVIYGETQGSSGFQFIGKINNLDSGGATGAIEELGWKFNVGSNGSWQSGPLPFGNWSISIKDSIQNSAKWMQLPLNNTDVQLGNVRLTPSGFALIPLWEGMLIEANAYFLMSSPIESVEMRISLDPTFNNSFWAPFRQIAQIEIPSSGKHQVYAQLRNFEGKESDIILQEINAEVLTLTAQADASIATETVSIDTPTTTITTTPPPGATQQSATIDAEELPRAWVDTSTPIPLSVPKSAASCGRHTVYIRFRNALGIESKSMTRTFNVRCWENNLPAGPLAARYEHGAAAVKLNGESSENGVFIWGGRNSNQLFNDGAILKLEGGNWTWVALSPSPLSSRTQPKIIAGKNHVMIFGGFDLAGNSVSDWGFYDLRTNTWITEGDFDAATKGTPPVNLKNAAVGYTVDLALPNNNGAFFIVGGEVQGQPTSTAVSEFYYSILERNGDLERVWTRQTAPKAVSRTNYARGAHEGFLFVHSGITTPSGFADPPDYSKSGSDFELSGDLQVFSFYTNEPNAPVFITRLYKSNDSRTGALNGHSFVLLRQQPDNTILIPDSTIETKAYALIEKHAMCIYGAQKYSDQFPNSCTGTLDGKIKLHLPFCRRIYDSYLFAPVAKLGVCFNAKPPPTELDPAYLSNFYLAISDAPAERRLEPQSAVSINSATMRGGVFYWSGISATGGEFLSDGKIYFSSDDRWVPITQFEAPSPRNNHSATYIKMHKRILIWGGQTATGITNSGAFYAIP